MDRRVDEKNIMYFYRHATSSILFLMILSLAFISIGYLKEKGQLFIAIGIVFLVICVYQFIISFFKKISGKYLDESAYEMMSRIKLYQNALDSLGISNEEADETTPTVLSGYCIRPIKTEPLFRFDSEDGKSRTSGYQVSLILLASNEIFTYTEIHSLVDKEYMSSSHRWKLGGIDMRMEEVRKDCFEQLGQRGPVKEGLFNELVIENLKGDRLTFAVEDDQMEDARKLIDYFNKTKGDVINLESDYIDNNDYQDCKANACGIGVIGDELGEL